MRWDEENLQFFFYLEPENFVILNYIFFTVGSLAISAPFVIIDEHFSSTMQIGENWTIVNLAGRFLDTTLLQHYKTPEAEMQQ